MANQADLKLALMSVVMTIGSSEDLARVFTFSCHLLKKRNQERARQSLLRLNQEGN